MFTLVSDLEWQKSVSKSVKMSLMNFWVAISLQLIRFREKCHQSFFPANPLFKGGMVKT